MSKVQEYSVELLDLISEYDEFFLQEWIDDSYFIEAMVFIHRHISAQLRYLLIKEYDKNSTKARCDEFLEVICRMDDLNLNRLAYLHDLIDKTELGNLKNLNTMRNNFVHPSQR